MTNPAPSTVETLKANKAAGFPIEAEDGTMIYSGPKDIAKKYQSDGRKVTTYLYTSPTTGDPEMAVFRLEPGYDGERKSFRQASPIARQSGTGWALTAPKGKRPLYNRKRCLETSDAIVIVEGEKCVHALHEVGIVATTSSGGAGNAKHSDWTILKGKAIILWPDNDPLDEQTGKSKGLEHMLTIAGILEPLGCAISMVDPAEFSLKDKGDAADFVAECKANGMDKDSIAMEIRFQLQGARSMGASRELTELIGDIIDGRHQVLESPWAWLDLQAQWLMPGTITVVCGDPGDGKSWWMFQLMRHIQECGHRIAIMTLEEDRQYWLRRVLAQVSNVPDIMDQVWVKAKPDEARRIETQFRPEMDKIGNRIADCPDKLIKFRDLLRWMEKELEAGARVLAIDPITAIETGDMRSKEDLEFVVEAKAMLRKYRASLVVITHPRGSTKGKRGLDDMAGGRAWSRFTQNVFWMEKTGAKNHFEVLQRDKDGKRQVVSITGNRMLHLFKTRNGKGAGKKIVMDFQDLLFAECGLHLKTLKKQPDGLPEGETEDE